MRTLPSAFSAALLLLSASALAGDLRIAFIDVGQGDAAVVIAPSGCAAVLDGGPTGSGPAIKAYLKSQGVSAIDFAVVSHYHLDHMGGIDELDTGTDAMPIATVYDRGGTYSSQAFTNYAAHFSGKRQTVVRNQVVSLCSEVTFKVVAVNGNGISSTNENAYSVAMKISYGSFDALIGGDLTGASPNIESTLIGQVGEVEVYKVHHHGSSTSSTDPFLDEIMPTVSVISVGLGNTYGHPTDATMTRLRNHGTIIYQTEDPATNTILGNVLVNTATGASFIVAQGGTSTPFASKGQTQDLSAPSAPANLVASASAGDTIDLSWTASTDNVGVTGYKVYRSANGNTFSLAGTSNTTGFADTGLNPGSTWSYRVTAIDAAGNESNVSNTATATTPTTADTQSPTAPTALSASAAGTSQIELSWSASSDNVGVTGYDVFRSVSGGAFNYLATVQSGTVFSDTGLSAATSYGYYVRAFDATGNVSANSATASATTASVATPGKVIINEILANEPGSATSGEFVELVNVGGSAVDISGWAIWDGSAARHTFASGTVLGGGKSIVVFGSASGIPAGTPNAIASSTGDLNLTNSGDTVSLRINKRSRADTFTFGSSLANQDGVSMNRSPDATDGAGFVLHNAISGQSASPGVRPSGAAY